MAGVEMVDGNPVELRAEILLHLGHEPPGERLEVIVFDTVFGGDDEAELMPFATGTVEEVLAVDAILFGAVKFAGLAIASDAVALDVAKMGPCRVLALAGRPDDAGLTITRRCRKPA
ncbi:hypothetical protein AJ88_46670 [Mesorhizobium amorphae CCBAU 01583]|nr:hypothetical protein AJ88_46670 [Mesorhizobium amorphae CCBAU 01583]